jgi:hypothetical protein
LQGAEKKLLSWFEVQTSLSKSFRNLIPNPHSGKAEIFRGDPASCATRGCNEYVSIENPEEPLDALLDLWWTLGFSSPYPSRLLVYLL